MDYNLICPTVDRLLVEVLPADEMSAGGIWVAATQERASLVRARVLRVGPGMHTQQGIVIEVPIPVGSIVIFPKGHMIEVSLGAKDQGSYAFVNAASILATITEPVQES